MATVVPAEGIILKRVLDAAHAVSPEGLSRDAYARFDAAQMKTAWGRHHRRRFALVDGAGADVLASATQYNLAGLLDEQSVRVCGIGEILTPPACGTGGHARELVDQLLDEASRDGAAIALLLSDMSHGVGAIQQALIAREPVERRPTIRAWFPRGLVPPQVTIVSTKPSTDVLMVRSLGSTVVQPPLSGDDVLYWHSDIF